MHHAGTVRGFPQCYFLPETLPKASSAHLLDTPQLRSPQVTAFVRLLPQKSVWRRFETQGYIARRSDLNHQDFFWPNLSISV